MALEKAKAKGGKGSRKRGGNLHPFLCSGGRQALPGMEERP